jgi:Protein of unknown function (DUF2752)
MAVQRSPSSAGFWELDEPLPALRLRIARAAAVAAGWILAGVPAALGLQRCAIATLFHVPCPGCGMTRALRLLASGRVDASLRMHPLAVPVLLAGALLMASTVSATATLGSPIRLHRTRFGRLAIVLALVVYAATLGLWGLRWLGYFGGPVPV